MIYHPKASPKKPFKEVFKDAMMHFNHLIKPHDQKSLNCSTLLFFMACGAAALGANCQPGFDAVYPYLYGGTDLDIDKVGFIIVQVKNDSTSYSDPSLDELFSKMDPFTCKLIDNIDKEDGRFPIPIIRIVFLLSGNNSFFKQHTPRNRRKPLFTSYDYVCAGIDPGILRPIQDSSYASWTWLVNERDSEDSCNEEERAVLRSQFPGGGSSNEYYTTWLKEDSLLNRYAKAK